MVDEAYKEQHKYFRWILMSLFVALLVGYIVAFLIFPIASWVHNGLGVDSVSRAINFFSPR